MSRTTERGFTLIELTAAGVIIMLLLGVSLFLLRPEDYTIIERSAKRRTALASMVQAINRYVADKGELPPGIPTKLTAISSSAGHYDLCKYLVPKYLRDLPMDPLVGIKITADNVRATGKCNAEGVTYATGYAIYTNKSGQVVVSSTIADNGAIELTVPRP